MTTFVHATAVVLGETGVLIEGLSGSGKTSLALALVADAAATGRFGRLVGDDRVSLTLAHGRIVARPHPAIAGRVEWRGLGLRTCPFEAACVVGLVVRLVTEAESRPERCPDRSPEMCLLSVNLPLLILIARSGARDNSARVFSLLFP